MGAQRLHQAHLFTGTCCVGKTTLAHTLAKAVNCELGVSTTPCGQREAYLSCLLAGQVSGNCKPETLSNFLGSCSKPSD